LTEESPKPAPRRLWKYLLAIFLLGLLAVAGGAWYMTTESFQS